MNDTHPLSCAIWQSDDPCDCGPTAWADSPTMAAALDHAFTDRAELITVAEAEIQYNRRLAAELWFYACLVNEPLSGEMRARAALLEQAAS